MSTPYGPGGAPDPQAPQQWPGYQPNPTPDQPAAQPPYDPYAPQQPSYGQYGQPASASVSRQAYDYGQQAPQQPAYDYGQQQVPQQPGLRLRPAAGAADLRRSRLSAQAGTASSPATASSRPPVTASRRATAHPQQRLPAAGLRGTAHSPISSPTAPRRYAAPPAAAPPKKGGGRADRDHRRGRRADHRRGRAVLGARRADERDKTFDSTQVAAGRHQDPHRAPPAGYGLTGIADVTCPSDQKVTAGTTFTCTLTQDGAAKTVTITVVDDSGHLHGRRPALIRDVLEARSTFSRRSTGPPIPCVAHQRLARASGSAGADGSRPSPAGSTATRRLAVAITRTAATQVVRCVVQA